MTASFAERRAAATTGDELRAVENEMWDECRIMLNRWAGRPDDAELPETPWDYVAEEQMAYAADTYDPETGRCGSLLPGWRRSR